MNNQLKMIIIFLISFLFVISCEEKEIEFENLYSYKNDKNISDSLGRQANDTISFIPIEHYYRKAMELNYDKRVSDFEIRYGSNFSTILRWLQEPVLTNYYQNKEIIRFTWLRSHHPYYIVLRLEKNNNEIKLIEKEFKEQKLCFDSFSNKYIDSVKFGLSTKIISKEIWNDFQKLIIDSSFTNITSISAFQISVDGSNWLLEIHKPNGYYFVQRNCPSKYEDGLFRKICEYILDLSSFKNEERY